MFANCLSHCALLLCFFFHCLLIVTKSTVCVCPGVALGMNQHFILVTNYSFYVRYSERLL